MRSPQLALQGSIGTGYSGASSRIIGYDTLSYILGYTIQSNPIPVGGKVTIPKSEKIPFNDQFHDNVNKSIGLGISIPILNGMQTYTNIKKTKLSLQNAEYNLQIIKNNLNKTIQQAYADAQASLNKYNATKKNLDALSESYKYAEEKYNVGLLNYVDFNDSKSKFIKAQSDLLQAKYDYVFRTKVLAFYMGKPLY
jgi:outer membrane protein